MPRARRWPSRSSRAPGGPVHLGRSRLDGLPGRADLISPTRRINLLGNSLVLIAGKEQDRRGDDPPGLRSRRRCSATAASRWAEVEAVPAGKYAKAALEQLGAWAGVEGKLAAGRERARGAGPGRPRRGAARHRLQDRRRGRSEREDRRHLPQADSHPPIIYPAAVTKDGERSAAAAFLSLPAQRRREAGVREAGLHRRSGRLGRDAGRCGASRRTSWTAIRLSLKVALWATSAACPRHPRRLRAGALGRFPGKLLLDGLVHLPLVLPPVVTGYPAADLRPARADRRPLAEHFGIVFSFRWTGAALACAVMAFPLLVRAMRLSIEAVDRGWRRPPAPSAPPRLVGVRHRHPAARGARRAGRHGAGLRQGAGRVRRHDHLRLQHPRRDPDPALGDLHLHPGPRRRGGRPAPDPGVDRPLRSPPDRLGAAGAAGGADGARPDARGRHRVPARRPSTSTPLRGRPASPRCSAAPAPARPRSSTPWPGSCAPRAAGSLDGEPLLDTDSRASTCRATAGGSATCSSMYWAFRRHGRKASPWAFADPSIDDGLHARNAARRFRRTRRSATVFRSATVLVAAADIGVGYPGAALVRWRIPRHLDLFG